MKIVSIDVTGNVGVVKVADLYRGLRFTDHLSVANIEGTWRIVNKRFITLTSDDWRLTRWPILHDFDDERTARILRTCRAAMPPGPAA